MEWLGSCGERVMTLGVRLRSYQEPKYRERGREPGNMCMNLPF